MDIFTAYVTGKAQNPAFHRMQEFGMSGFWKLYLLFFFLERKNKKVINK